MQFNVWLYSRFQQSPLSNFRLVTEIKGKNVKSNRLIWSAARYWCLSHGCHNVLYVMDRALLIIEHAALFKHKLTQWFGAVSIAPLECWKPTLLLLPLHSTGCCSFEITVILGGRFGSCAIIASAPFCVQFSTFNWIETYYMLIRQPLDFVYYSHSQSYTSIYSVCFLFGVFFFEFAIFFDPYRTRNGHLLAHWWHCDMK